MSLKTHHFRIGLFVLVGALLFVGALFAMGLRSYFGARDLFETCVPGKVDNLSVGALVKLRGVTVGKVTAIDFAGKEYPHLNQDAVVIHFEIPKDTIWSAETNNVQALINGEVARGLRARVQGQGFLGASILALEYVDPDLYPVEPVPFTPRHYYIPSAPSQINRVLGSLERTLRHVENLDLDQLLARAKTLIDSANQLVVSVNQIDFKKLETNADSVLAHVDQVNFKELGTNADALVLDLRDTNRRLQGALKDADIPALRGETVALEAKLSAAAVDLRRLLGGMDMGDLNGSLANVRNATDELIVLLHTLEQRPSAVIFSRSPPPVSQLDHPPRK